MRTITHTDAHTPAQTHTRAITHRHTSPKCMKAHAHTHTHTETHTHTHKLEHMRALTHACMQSSCVLHTYVHQTHMQILMRMCTYMHMIYIHRCLPTHQRTNRRTERPAYLPTPHTYIIVRMNQGMQTCLDMHTNMYTCTSEQMQTHQ